MREKKREREREREGGRELAGFISNISNHLFYSLEPMVDRIRGLIFTPFAMGL